MFKIEQAILKVSNLLNVSSDQAYAMLAAAFDTENPVNYLMDLLGMEEIEMIFEIVQNKILFESREIKNDEITYIEHICPKQISIAVDPSTLVPVKAVKNHQKYFKYERFNPVQSKVFECAYKSDKNILVSAPTGAGKTDIALLTILRCLEMNQKAQIIYMVPMKALATEITRKYSQIFDGVIEYTGDTEITPKEANKARIIICTPEKFDVSTRRLCPTFTNIKLVIIDEIHLLEDERGPVIEAIVARMFNLSILQQSIIRIVGLSATLPNYLDVGEFIKAEKCFNFDQKYRPVPLETHIIGFKKNSKKIDEIEFLIKKVEFFRNLKKQILIFVSSRNKTEKIAKILIDDYNSKSNDDNNINNSVNNTNNKNDIKNGYFKFHGKSLTPVVEFLVNNRVGIHHAGLPRKDRLTVERMFREGKLDVLICTSTLAWGVNLPAHVVFIYGTTFYNPSKARIEDMGICDVLQIFGRAGRPQYDTEGVAYLITQSNKIDHYLNLIKRSNNIESKFLFHVTDSICAEVYLRNIRNIPSALPWIKNTFLYVRILKNPALYGLLQKDVKMEEQALIEYINLSILRLESFGLISILKPESNFNTWKIYPTPFGRISSIFYLQHSTIKDWNDAEIFKNNDLLILLLKSKDFSNISLRTEEIGVLTKMTESMLLDRILDFEFDDSVECKMLVLVLAYINFRHPCLFTLQCDTEYIVDNLKRLISAFREVAIYKKEYSIIPLVFDLERRILRIRMKVKEIFEVKMIRIGRYAELKICKNENNHTLVSDNMSDNMNDNNSILVSDNKKNISQVSSKNYKSYAFLKFKNHIFQVLQFSNELQEFIQIPSFEDLEIEIYQINNFIFQKQKIILENDYSMNALYKYGIHSCDSNNSNLSNNSNQSGFSFCGSQLKCEHLSVFEEFENNLFYENNLCVNNNSLCVDSNSSSKNSSSKNSSIYHSKELQTFVAANYFPFIYSNNYSKQLFEFSDFFKEPKFIFYHKNIYNNNNFNNNNFLGIFDIKFNIQFQYFCVESDNYTEKLKMINQQIFDIENLDSHCIICPSKHDSDCTIVELNTLNFLFSDNFQFYDSSNVFVFKKQKIDQKIQTVIFKTFGFPKYFIYDILKMCNFKKVIIFETRNFIEYFKEITK